MEGEDLELAAFDEVAGDLVALALGLEGILEVTGRPEVEVVPRGEGDDAAAIGLDGEDVAADVEVELALVIEVGGEEVDEAVLLAQSEGVGLDGELPGVGGGGAVALWRDVDDAWG